MKTKNLIIIALFTAILCVISPFKIILPFTPVPITLQVIGVSLCGIILGSKKGSLSVLIYLILGSFGLPVFSGFTGGIQILVGPTGGYLVSFVVAAFVMGMIFEKSNTSLPVIILSNLIGLLIVYILGSINLSLNFTHSLINAFKAGVIPFIIPDLVKIAIVSYLEFILLKRNFITTYLKN